MKSLFTTAEEACLAVGIDFDGIYPAPGKNHRLDITGDPRGKGDANIYTFPDKCRYFRKWWLRYEFQNKIAGNLA